MDRKHALALAAAVLLAGGAAAALAARPARVHVMLARAKGYAGKVRYQLGGKSNTAFDCSWFVKLVLQLPKYWPTADIVADLKGARTTFRPIPAAKKGALVVYSGDEVGKETGHVAFVVDPKKRLIIDNSEGKGGVTVHDGTYFWNLVAKGQAT